MKDSATKAIASARDAASGAGRRASESIETSPLAVLAGGVALGVLIGAALPRLAREEELLAPVGQKLAGGAREAIGAAKQRGREELDTLGLSRAAAKVQAGKVGREAAKRGKEISGEASVRGKAAAKAAAQEAKKAGTVRLEGKTYIVQDGDICHFLFNV